MIERFDIFSQFGEDGLLHGLLAKLGIERGFCVEFGAWDGLHLSNTARLLRSCGWSGVLIEGEPTRYAQLCMNYKTYSRVTTLDHVVGLEGDYTLDKILARETTAPAQPDLLSIDIDGCDYHVWQTVEQFRAKVVVIEFNPTIPLGVDFVQPRDLTVFQGSSLAALIRLGQEKGYQLAACTEVNAVFIDRALGYQGTEDPGVLWRDQSKHVTHIFSLYDGTIKLAGAARLPWHGRKMEEEKMQVIPLDERKFIGALR